MLGVIGLLALVATGIEVSTFKMQIAAIGLEQTTVQAMFAATALGMQNGLTSNFRGMAVRTTHFTGTVTDLGLMLGRSRRHGLEKWKAAILTATFVLFLVGGESGWSVVHDSADTRYLFPPRPAWH